MQLHGRRAEIEAAGAELIFIGNGSPAFAGRFAERQVPGARVLTDPSLAIHRALGLKRGVMATLGPASLVAGVKSTLKGHRQTAIEGDPWQQGGLLVAVPGGELIFEQRNQDAGDRPDLDGALGALRNSRRLRRDSA